MPATSRKKWLTAVAIVWCLSTAGIGCQTCHTSRMHHNACQRPVCNVPRELIKTTLPTYVVEPPDILLVNMVKILPKPSYLIDTADVLNIQFPVRPLPRNILDPKEPDPKEKPLESPPPEELLARQGLLIQGQFQVEVDGTVNLRGPYGRVRVAGKTIKEVQEIIEQAVQKRVAAEVFKAGEVFVGLAEFRGMQQIQGEHLVRPDGTIGLGAHGDVFVAGQPMPVAKRMIEAHLGQFFVNPEVTLDVGGYNSKVFYIITDGAGSGQQVYRFPVTGNETVLDAMSQIGGLGPVSSQKRIWVARPTPGEMCCRQTLPVNWKAITQVGDTSTNYQLLPGDRIFVHSVPLIYAETIIARVTAPIERLLGITLLGNGVVQNFRNSGQQGGGFGGGFGGF